MAATAKLVTPPATEPTTVLQRLHAERAEIMDQVKRLMGVSARLNTEAAAGDALNAELDRLAETETTEMKVWAAGGCVGNPPKGKQTERQAIAVKMAATNATAAAARGAIADTNNQIAALNDRQRSLNNEIDQAVFDHVGHEHDGVAAEYRAVCERASRLAAKIAGLAMYYRDAGFLQQASVISATKLPNPGTNRLEIMAAADVWGRRINDLRKGA